ncbi:hypothetical protein ACNKHK_02750 [Shigella flexneri]
MVNNPSVMVNLIGSDLNYDWLKHRWYTCTGMTKKCVKGVRWVT